MTDNMILKIRHQILVDGGVYVVRETFGDQPRVEWRVPDLAAANALVAERKAMLLKIIASISDDARRAVEDARHIDNLKAGRA